MPEGDTVHRAAKRLDRNLSGQVLTGSDFRVPSLATVDLSGQQVHRTISRGKHLLTRIGELTLHTHFGMDGSWVFDRRPNATTRVVLTTERTTALGNDLQVDLVPSTEENTVVGHLGPDLLGPDWDPELAAANLRREPEVPLVVALLDQRNLAGIGNVYACELAFLAGLDPHTPIGQTPDLERLVRRAHLLLDANKDRVSRIITGQRRNPTWVYGRRDCLRCGTRTHTDDIGPAGRERHTWWCPSCQPPL